MPSAIETKNVTRSEILDMMNEKEKLEQQLKSLGEVLQSVSVSVKCFMTRIQGVSCIIVFSIISDGEFTYLLY